MILDRPIYSESPTWRGGIPGCIALLPVSPDRRAYFYLTGNWAWDIGYWSLVMGKHLFPRLFDRF